MRMGDFDGMAALVTGGGSGIGAATADLLAERGARVALLDLEPGDGGRHLPVACDVADRALYAASKGAVLALTLAMAADHLGDGIRVNCVTPGTAETPWIGRLLAGAGDPGATLAALRARQPMGRLVTAAEVAAAIAYLASPQAGATTGTSLVVDGGLTGLRYSGDTRREGGGQR
jgi:NAD(P)-dependent dehydrogenase (short-subunit alcohol dehydrogenase family)